MASGYPIGGLERAENGTHRGRGHTVALPLELDSLQAASRLVELEKRDQRNATEHDPAKHDWGIAVAEIDRPRHHRRLRAEMGEQSAPRLAPIGPLPEPGDVRGASRPPR